MALFEVISKSRDKNPDSEVTVPNWIKPSSGEPDQTAGEPQVQDSAAEEPAAPESETQTSAPLEEVAAAEPKSPSTPVLPTTSTWEPRRSPETPKVSNLPIWSTSGGRLILSLNYVSCLVVSTGIVLLIVAAFVVGHMVGSRPATPAGAQSGQPVVKRQVGKYYMVIETLNGNTREARAEADQIVKFCAANGEPSEVQLLPKVVNGKVVKGQGNLIVWSLTPFDSPKSEEVRAHALHIQNELGPKYARKHGSKYKFNQPEKNGKLVPLMFPYGKNP